MTAAEELARALGAPVSEVDARRLVPMLCEREESAALERAGWLYELKLDGVRIVADRRGTDVRLCYRKLRDATESYPEVVEALAALGESRVVLDGEIVAFDADGRPSFQRLGSRIQTKGASARVAVVYVVFDVLAVGAHDLRRCPIEARKEVLARVLPERSSILRGHPTFSDGRELFRLCREHRLEGIVAKKLGSSYETGQRTPDWVKIKCENDAEFVVIGWTEGESTRSRLGALDLGAYEDDRLVFRGRVGSGLDDATIDLLLARLVPIEVAEPVAHGTYSPKPKRHHCRPELVVSVRYGGFSADATGARALRFPVFRGIRVDVDPHDCTAAPQDGVALDRTASPEQARRIHVTAPTRLVAKGTTKNALCIYFEGVAPALLEGLAGRTCTLVRPDGRILLAPSWTPKFVRMARDGGFVLDSVDALLFAVEAGAPILRHALLRRDLTDAAAVLVVSPLRDARSQATGLLRALLAELDLTAVPVVTGSTAIEIRIGLGKAAPNIAASLAAVLAGIVTRTLGREDVQIRPLELVTAVFSPVADGPEGRFGAAMPVAWDDLLPVLLDDAASRVASAKALVAPLAAAKLDEARLIRALERLALRHR